MRGSTRRRWRGRWSRLQPSLDKRAAAAIAVARDPRCEQRHDRLHLPGIIAPAADPFGLEAARELGRARRQYAAAADFLGEIAQRRRPLESHRAADPTRLAIEIGD